MIVAGGKKRNGSLIRWKVIDKLPRTNGYVSYGWMASNTEAFILAFWHCLTLWAVEQSDPTNHSKCQAPLPVACWASSWFRSRDFRSLHCNGRLCDTVSWAILCHSGIPCQSAVQVQIPAACFGSTSPNVPEEAVDAAPCARVPATLWKTPRELPASGPTLAAEGTTDDDLLLFLRLPLFLLLCLLNKWNH